MIKRCLQNIFFTCLLVGISSITCWSQGPPPPPAGDYLSSGHGQGASRAATAALGYAPGNCIHCHEQHAGNDYLKFTPAIGYQFCTNSECHSSTGAASDIRTAWEFRTYTHGKALPAMECVDCHDPHFSGPSHSPGVDGNDATQGAIRGSSGVSAVWNIPSTPGAGQETLSAPILTPKVPIDFEYELCLKCHSIDGGGVSWPISSVSSGVVLTDQGEEFNPNNFSSHPIELQGGTWKNPFLANPVNTAAAMNPPWEVPNRKMHCSDCHGGDGITDPKGPHGSNNIYMLKATGPGLDPPFDSYNDLCLLCHDPINGASAFDDHNTGGHPDGCLHCHGGNNDTTGAGDWGGRPGSIHGVNYQWRDYDDRGTIRPGLPARRFLVGGSLTELWDEGAGKYGCSMQSSTYTDPGCGQHAEKTWTPPNKWPNTLP